MKEKFREQIVGELNCYDRVIITGSLQPLCYARGMTAYLYQEGIRIFDYTQFAEPLREEIRTNAEKIATENHIKIEFIRKKNFRQEERIRELLAERGNAPGLVHIFGAMEACQSYQPWHDKASGKNFVKPASGKCLHYYFYFIDAELGLCFMRVATWCPFTTEFYCNGHNWLASKLREKKINFVMQDNAFTQIADFATANKLAQEFSAEELHHKLDDFAARYSPVVARLGLQYHWSLRQVEYATDLIFEPGNLSSIFLDLLRILILCVKPEDVATFLGRQLRKNSANEVRSSFNERHMGTRIKHAMGPVSIKMYDKFGFILRIETTVNDVSFFQQYREVVHRDGNTELKWTKMKKNIYSLSGLATTLFDVNHRYLNFISAIETPEIGVSFLDVLTKTQKDNNNAYKGFNFLSTEDANIFRALLHGEFAVNGFSHKSLRKLLPDKTPGQISRLLKRLRVHKLIKKSLNRYKYRLSTLGMKVAATILKLRELVVIPELSEVAVA